MKNKIKDIILIFILVLLIIIGIYSQYLKTNAGENIPVNIPTLGAFGKTGDIVCALAENSGSLLKLDENQIKTIITSKQALSADVCTKHKISPIYHRSCGCLYHQVSTEQGSAFVIRDFIDINTNGIGTATIYHGEEDATNIEKNTVDIPDGFATILAYLMNKKWGEDIIWTSAYEGDIDDTKQVLRAVFKNNFAEYIKDYVSDAFYVESDISDTSLDANNSIYQEALKVKESIIPFTNKTTGEPTTNFASSYDGHVYYGPFKVVFKGFNIDADSIEGPNGLQGKLYYYDEVTEKYIEFPTSTRKVTLDDGTSKNIEYYQDVYNNRGEKIHTISGGEIYIGIGVERGVPSSASIKIKSTEINFYKARMLLLTRMAGGAQQLALYDAVKDTVIDDITLYVGDHDYTGSIQIQKVDKYGNNLNLAGIKFKITDSNGKLINTVETKSDGKTEKISELPFGKYIIEEIENQHYGYGENKNKTKSVTINNNNKDIIYEYENSKSLGDFRIIKKGPIDSIYLQNVEFKIQRITNKGTEYAVLKNASGGKVSTITGGITIATNNVASGSTYRIEWVNSLADATTFKTNNNGEINIKNLEIFYELNKNIIYKAVEIYNPNYGYKGNTYTTIGNKLAVNGGNRVTSTATVVNNISKGHLAINKVDEENNDIKVAGMVFTIKNESEYIQLKSGSTVQSSFTGTVNADSYTVNYVRDVNSATKFVTDANGNITVKNLEVYKASNSKYAYTVTEVASNNPNYDASGYGIGELTQNATTYVGRSGYSTSSSTVFTNKRKDIDVSGYVWLENYSGKASELNGKYDSGESKVSGVKVYLKEGTTTIKNTTTGTNGEYKFTKVDVTKVKNYHIEFEYDGVIYQSTTTGQQSKGTDAASRTALDSVFASVQKSSTGTSTVYADSTHNVTYNRANNPTSISSTTGCNVIATTGTYLKDTYKDGMTAITNVNLGIYKKIQADLALTQDVDNVNVGINGYWHVYKYNQRMSEYDGKGWNVGVVFKNSYSGQYNLPIYKADYEYETQNGTNELEVYLTYKIAITNQSSYKSKVNKINYYYDNRLSLIGVGKFVNTTNNSIEEAISVTNIKDYNNNYKQITIDLSSTNTLDSGKSGFIYVQFKLTRDGIKAIFEDNVNNELFNTASEILSYTNYNTNGKTVAVVDKDSIPGNYNLGNVAGTDEDDSDQAPTVKLVITESRKLTGTVFVDSTTGKLQSGKERLGDGKYNSGEKTVNGVKVQLCRAKDNSVIKEITTDANGNYTFTEFAPDEYIIKFIWGNQTYTVSDYKGTIYNDKDRQNDGKWYQNSVDVRNSDAIDNYSLRLQLDSKIKDINKENIVKIKEELKNAKMESITPKMDIAIESMDTKLNNLSSGMNKVEYLIKNVDFGIVERPRQKLQLDKDVTAFKIVSPTGTVLVDATVKNGKVEGVIDHLSYIKDSFIKAEMSEELIQGSTLQITYALKVTNIGELDYISEEYYKYGTGKDNKNLVQITPITLIDYLESDLGYDSSINTGWLKVSTLDIGIKPEYTLEKNNLNSKIILKNTSLADNILKPGDSSKELKLTVSKLLATSTDSTFNNTAEVISVKQNGGRLIEEFPSAMAEKSMVTPSTGENKDIMYLVIGAVSLIILASGIVIIKKKVLKNK